MTGTEEELFDLAERTAREAGALARRHRESAVGVTATKSSATDVVTAADTAVEDLVRSRIVAARPDDAILGEEGSHRAGRSGLTWVVDPIDGTVNYLHGIARYATSIAVEDAEGPVVLGRVWVIRHRDPLDYPEPPDPWPEPPPPPETLGDTPFAFAAYTWFGDSLDTRVVEGAIDGLGRATAWFRLRVPVVAGEEPTPEQRLATMVDSGNGISWGLPFGEWLFINSDVTAYLLRRPAGEWFAMEAVSHYDRGGRGIAETRLFDQHGYLGRSHQALFVDELTQ